MGILKYRDKYGVSGGWEEHTGGIIQRGQFSLFIDSF